MVWRFREKEKIERGKRPKEERRAGRESGGEAIVRRIIRL